MPHIQECISKACSIYKRTIYAHHQITRDCMNHLSMQSSPCMQAGNCLCLQSPWCHKLLNHFVHCCHLPTSIHLWRVCNTTSHQGYLLRNHHLFLQTTRISLPDQSRMHDSQVL